ncbi:hypothetical protein [Amphritea sp.]|uniref:hypothetical protein n=1 Tax=Amphritea sp. TaxID=1872502 RepID=UPI003A8D5FEC
MSVKKYTAYNLVSTIISVVLALITIPVYIDVVGESRYGVLAVAWLMLGYFSLFYLGLGRAVVQRIIVLGSVDYNWFNRCFCCI